eukprot:m.207869 g.207869  ORF g.207869 m.207869 type:complete len:568 (+) comp25408_c0_seq3:324-2027(+)
MSTAATAPLGTVTPRVGPNPDGQWGMAVHGGAGAITDTSTLSARTEAFTGIVTRGRDLLASGATAVEVCIAVVAELEDCIYFNAGRGSVFTHTGTHEMDACIMDGTSMAAGAVANVSNTRNPIKLAAAVATGTQHVLMVGLGAEALAPKFGIQREDSRFFFSEERYAQLKVARATQSVVLDHGGALEANTNSYATVSPDVFALTSTSPDPDTSTPSDDLPVAATATATDLKWAGEEKFSTVGCVVRDAYGNLASAGSTGGLCNKQPGRVGDTPIPGAGVYANSKTCAVACTGHGETFIKHSVAYDIHARMAYKNDSLQEAMTDVILHTLPPETGGCVGVDSNAEAFALYNTQGMFSGLADSRGRFDVWHRRDLGTPAALAASVVPDVVDPFTSHGVMTVQVARALGTVSRVLVTASQDQAKALDGALLATPPIVSVFRQRDHQPSPTVAQPPQHIAFRTLLMVSPDCPTHEDSVKDTQMLHWAVCNIPSNTQSPANGTVVLAYDPPVAPETGSGFRRYVFLLCSQRGPVDPCTLQAGVRDPRKFSARAFISENDLTVVSGDFTWAKW